MKSPAKESACAARAPSQRSTSSAGAPALNVAGVWIHVHLTVTVVWPEPADASVQSGTNSGFCPIMDFTSTLEFGACAHSTFTVRPGKTARSKIAHAELLFRAVSAALVTSGSHSH